MRKRKRRRYSGKLSMLYISIIISLGAMGVGYAAWNDGLNVAMNLTTGFIKPAFVIENLNFSTGDEYLNFELSDDGQTLIIGGEVYHGFDKDIEIMIRDGGSIPVELGDIDENIREVSNIEDNEWQFVENIETFNLNIKPEDSMDEDSLSTSEELSGLEWDIMILEEEIKKYKKSYLYEFEYKLTFDQGI